MFSNTRTHTAGFLILPQMAWVEQSRSLCGRETMKLVVLVVVPDRTLTEAPFDRWGIRRHCPSDSVTRGNHIASRDVSAELGNSGMFREPSEQLGAHHPWARCLISLRKRASPPTKPGETLRVLEELEILGMQERPTHRLLTAN